MKGIRDKLKFGVGLEPFFYNKDRAISPESKINAPMFGSPGMARVKGMRLKDKLA